MVGQFQSITLLLALGGIAADEPILRNRHALFESRAQKFGKFRKGCKADCPEYLEWLEWLKSTYDEAESSDEAESDEDIGDNSGIPNLEYLGLGYNIFEGNPRGSDISEVDPGFRSPVIKLRQTQTRQTIDQEYLVPVGVHVRYTTACKFASKATEISSEAEYRSEVAKEASQSNKASISGSYGMYSMSANLAFSKSEQYKKFSETKERFQTVTFEARALCSEFRASFKEYDSHVQDETFEMALNSLSFPWIDTAEQRVEYKRFLDSYGTHYVRDLTLGAKHIYSSEIKSKDVDELSRENIDVSSSLSWDVQAAYNSEKDKDEDDNGSLPREVEETKITKNESDDITGSETFAKKFKYVFEESNPSPPSPTTNPIGAENPKKKQLEASFSRDTSKSESSSSSSGAKIQSKITSIKELNVGGNPPEDGNWRAWASTVRDRPMPIAYELEGIWNLMNETSREAFRDAVVKLYDIDMRDPKDDTIIQALRFGVYRGDGSSVSSYNRSPSSNYRSDVQLAVKGREETASEFTGDVVQAADNGAKSMNIETYCDAVEWSPEEGYTEPDEIDYFVCGFAIQRQPFQRDDGIGGLKVRFCKFGEWDVYEDKVVRDNGSSFKNMRTCDYGQYAIGLKVKVDVRDGTNTREHGMDGLWIDCAPIDIPNFVSRKKIYSHKEGKRSYTSIRNGKTSFMRGVKVRYCSETKNNGIGLFGIDVEYAPPQGSGVNPFQSNEYSIPSEGGRIAAIFATPIRQNIGRNRMEDKNQVGFSIYSPSAEKDIFNVMSNIPFGFFQDSRAKVLVQDFKQGVFKRDEMQSFSFLSATNLPDEAEYVVGIVHPDGTVVNDEFRDEDVGFEIEQINEERLKPKFRITFTDLSNPTFLVFPLWFPGFSGTFPQKLGSVVAATERCDGDECDVVLGAGDNSLADYNLGFCFLALDGSLDATKVSGIAHGVVTVNSNLNRLNRIPDLDGLFGSRNVHGRAAPCSNHPDSNNPCSGVRPPVQNPPSGPGCSTHPDADGCHPPVQQPPPVQQDNAQPTVTFEGSGFSAEPLFTDSTQTFNMFGGKDDSGNVNLDEFKFQGYGGGILITFDDAFRGLPSVIVNPISGNRNLDVTATTDEFALPYVVVEHITERSAVVKAYWLNTRETEDSDDGFKEFEPISFHIVAVAPQSDPFLPLLDDSFIA